MENKGAIVTLAIVIVAFLLLVFILTGLKDQNYDVDLGNLNGKVLGDENAPVTIVEWGDFECPYCSSFSNEVLPKLIVQYIAQGEVKYIYKHFPRIDKTKALESECANEQGKFWEYHNALYAGSTYSNLDKEKFEDCVKKEKYLDDVNDDFLDGLNLGVRATPTFVINGRIIEGAIPYETFVALIDIELNN